MQWWGWLLIILFIIVAVGGFAYRYKKSHGGMAAFQITSTPSHLKCGAIASMHFLCAGPLREIALNNLTEKVSAGAGYLEPVVKLLQTKCTEILDATAAYEFSGLIETCPGFYGHYAHGPGGSYVAYLKFILDALNINNVDFNRKRDYYYNILSKPGTIRFGEVDTNLRLVSIKFVEQGSEVLKIYIIALLLSTQNICSQFIMEELEQSYSHVSTFKYITDIPDHPPFWLHYPDEYDPKTNVGSTGYAAKPFFDLLNKSMVGILMLVNEDSIKMWLSPMNPRKIDQKIEFLKDKQNKSLKENITFTKDENIEEYRRQREKYPESPT